MNIERKRVAIYCYRKDRGREGLGKVQMVSFVILDMRSLLCTKEEMSDIPAWGSEERLRLEIKIKELFICR